MGKFWFLTSEFLSATGQCDVRGHYVISFYKGKGAEGTYSKEGFSPGPPGSAPGCSSGILAPSHCRVFSVFKM